MYVCARLTIKTMGEKKNIHHIKGILRTLRDQTPPTTKRVKATATTPHTRGYPITFSPTPSTPTTLRATSMHTRTRHNSRQRHNRLILRRNKHPPRTLREERLTHHGNVGLRPILEPGEELSPTMGHRVVRLSLITLGIEVGIVIVRDGIEGDVRVLPLELAHASAKRVVFFGATSRGGVYRDWIESMRQGGLVTAVC